MRTRIFELSHGSKTELCIDVTNKRIKRLYIAANDILSNNALTKLFIVKKLNEGFMDGKIFIECDKFLEILKKNQALLGNQVTTAAYNHVNYIKDKIARKEEKIINKIYPNIAPIVNDDLTVTSENVAGVYGRSHDCVCQYIERLRPLFGKEWFKQNFEKTEDGFKMNQEGLNKLAETFKRVKDPNILAWFSKIFMEKYQMILKENQNLKNTSAEEKQLLINKIMELSELSNVPASKISKEIHNISLKEILQEAMDKDTFHEINSKLDKKIAEFQYWQNSKPC